VPARIPDEDPLDELRAVADELGGAPKRAEYREHGTHQPETITDHFGGWIDTPETAGLDPDTRAIGEGIQVSCPRCEYENRYSGDERSRSACRGRGFTESRRRRLAGAIAHSRISEELDSLREESSVASRRRRQSPQILAITRSRPVRSTSRSPTNVDSRMAPGREGGRTRSSYRRTSPHEGVRRNLCGDYLADRRRWRVTRRN
jgi:hypothetical protein